MLELVALILALVGPLLALARLLRVPDTLVLFGAGVAAAFAPGLPAVKVDPQLMLGLFLPPILYAATVRVSHHLLRFTLVSGVLLGAALTLATIAAVALAAKALLPGLPPLAAALLGIVLAVFDTRLFHEAKGRPHVPRVIADALKSREMVARLTALTCFALALDALEGTPLTPAGAVGGAALDLVGGAALGTVLGYAVVSLRERIDPAPVEIAASIATPYLGSLLAAAFDLSVVAVIIAAALVVSAERVAPATGAPRTSTEARISSATFWEQVSLILSAILFFLVGRALPDAMAALDDLPLWQLVVTTAALLAVVLAVQFAASLAATALPLPADELGAEEREPLHRVAAAGVMAWASTRSVIGLVVALSIPAAFPDGRPFAERDLVLVLAALVTLGSVLLQGLTLRPVVRAADLADTGEAEREKRAAERAVAEASPQGGEDFRAARRALFRLRQRNRVGDETLRATLREVDLRQRATEESALPGAGPPNP